LGWLVPRGKVRPLEALLLPMLPVLPMGAGREGCGQSWGQAEEQEERKAPLPGAAQGQPGPPGKARS